MKLAGKRAIVTGSSSGIGRSIALLLASEGASVVINARGSGNAGTGAIDAVVDEIRSAGGTAIGLAGAVNDETVAQKLVEHCVDAFGGVDILVNNAGTYDPLLVADCPPALWREVMDINLNSAFYMAHHALPHMMKRRWGRILNASSYNASGLAGGSAYAASKAAMIGLTRAMAADYGPYGITVNAYNPEALTNMGAGGDPEVFKGLFIRWRDRGYMSDADVAYKAGIQGPEGVAPWIAYLCLDEAAHFNGHVFALEGRRIAMLSWPEEARTLYHDFQADGPWSLDELSALAPLFFPATNRWPPLDEAALIRREAI
jgi:NAD(P)-dependent dehydrogenase (short-subunit alcohol dehydrogenase family)